MINNTDNDKIVTTTTETIIKTVSLGLWFEGMEKQGYIPFHEDSTEDNVIIQKSLVKPLMFFLAKIAEPFGRLAMPGGIEIKDGSKGVYDPSLNVMNCPGMLRFVTLTEKTFDAMSLIKRIEEIQDMAPYFLIGVTVTEKEYACPLECKSCSTFDGSETDDWFIYVRKNEPRPQFPKSAYSYLKKPLMALAAGLAFSKKYTDVTGGFKAFMKDKHSVNSVEKDFNRPKYNKPVEDESPKFSETPDEHADSIRIAMFTEDGERMPTKTEMALKLKEEENRIDRKFQNHRNR